MAADAQTTDTPRGASRKILEGYNQPRSTPVRDVRKAAKLSLRDLEDVTGINRGIWSQIENGKLMPQQRHLHALSAALGVPLDEWELRFVLERVSR